MSSKEFIFFRTPSGGEPVREWLMTLDEAVRKVVGRDLEDVRLRWPRSNKRPLVDGFGEGLFEVRSSHDGNQYRVLFCFFDGHPVALHAFQKKTQKTPPHQVEVARKRQRLVMVQR